MPRALSHFRFAGVVCALLATPLLSGGCVTQMSEEDLTTQLEEAAQPFEPLGRRRVIPIYAETPFIARVLLTEAQANPDSPLTASVSKRLGIAARRKFHVVVGGPYPELSDRVLRNALDAYRKDGLAGLTVVYVSDIGPSVELTAAAREAHAHLHYRALQQGR